MHPNPNQAPPVDYPLISRDGQVRLHFTEEREGWWWFHCVSSVGAWQAAVKARRDDSTDAAFTWADLYDQVTDLDQQTRAVSFAIGDTWFRTGVDSGVYYANFEVVEASAFNSQLRLIGEKESGATRERYPISVSKRELLCSRGAYVKRWDGKSPIAQILGSAPAQVPRRRNLPPKKTPAKRAEETVSSSTSFAKLVETQAKKGNDNMRYIQKFTDGEFAVFANRKAALAVVSGLASDELVGVLVKVNDDLGITKEALAADAIGITVEGHSPHFAKVNAAYEAAISTTRTRGDRVKDQAKSLGQAVALGAALGAMDATGDVLLKLAHRLAPTVPILSTMLADPQGREIVKMLMATLIHTAAVQTDLVPKKEVVARVAEFQVTVSTMKLLAPHLEMLGEVMLDLVKAGEKLPEELPSARNLFSGTNSRAVDAEVIEQSTSQKVRAS